MRRIVYSFFLLLLFAVQFSADSGEVGFLVSDVNRDRAVNFDDFFLLTDQFGQSCTDECSQLTADLNADRTVNLDDFFLMVDQFGLSLTSLIEPLARQNVAPGTTLTLHLEPAAGIVEELSYALLPLPLPDGASFDAAAGVFTFTPSLDQAGQEFVLTVWASVGERNDCQDLRITVAAVVPGATSLSGLVLDTNDFTQGVVTPVVGAQVSLLGTEFSTSTDADGRFSFSGIPATGLVLDIDPEAAQVGPDGAVYAGFREKLTVLEGVDNIIERPFYLPRIAAESLTAVDPESMTRVENASLGIVVEVAAGSARDESGALFDGQLSISEVPENLAPAALPENLDFGLLITIQPVGVSFDPPAQLTFPNVDGIAPGNEAEIWSLDPISGQFAVVGIGVVSVDGSVIETVEGGIRRADWHGTSQGVRGARGRIWGGSANQDKSRCSDCETGSRTTLATGNLSIRHDLVSYRSLEQRRSLRLVYNSIYAKPRPILGADVTIDQRFAVPPLLSARLRVAGVNQPEEVFTETAGLDEDRNEDLRQILQFDASGLATGSYAYCMTFTSHYSRSAVSSSVAGQLLVNNLGGSPFGAGWSLDGVQRLYVQRDGAVVLTEGDGSIKRFDLGTVGTGTFAESGRFGVGSFPRDVKTADFNQDGILDLVSADHDSDQLSLLLGTGGGSFSAASTFAVGDGPWDMAVADYNRDGLADLAVTNELSDDISIYLGNGFGGFRPERRIVVGDRPLMIDSGDMDGDGNPDLVLANGVGGARGVSVLLGDGRGEFNAGGFTAAAAQDVQIGDMDGDRRLDVIASLWPRNTVSLLLGDGQGGLGDPVDTEAGNQVTNGADLADVDLDGDLDLLVPNFGSADVSVLLNDGSGNFDAPLRFATGPNARRVITGDFDVDGFLDMAVPNQGGRSVSVLLGDGTGSFATAVNYTVGTTPRSIVAADFDGDGLLDLAVGNSGDRNIMVLLGVATSDQEVALKAPPGEFSRIVANEDGTFTRSTPDGIRFEFDAAGYHVATVDRKGNTTAYDYDSDGLLQSVTDPMGLQIDLDYSGGRLASITDPADRTTRFDYDGDDLARITDPDGSTRLFSYNADHHLTEKVGKDGSRTLYAYDFAGHNIGAIRSDGTKIATASSDGVGLGDFAAGEGGRSNPLEVVRPEAAQARMTDELDNEKTLVTDSFGSAIDKIDVLGRRTLVERNVNGDPVQIESADGTRTGLVYDVRGYLSGVTEGVGGGEERITQVEYSADLGLVSRIVDGAGGEMLFERDAAGNLVGTTNAAGGRNALAYNERGLVTTKTDPEDNTVAYTYDAKGNLESITDAAGSVMRLGYDAAGNITSVTEAAGTVSQRTSRLGYDARNRVIESEDADGKKAVFNYDSAGQLIERVDLAGGSLRLEYDDMGRIVAVDHPLYGIWDYTYDEKGRLVEFTDPIGGTHKGEYDAAGRLLRVDDASGNRTQYTYDELNQPVGLVDAAGNEIRFIRDDLGRIVERVNPVGQRYRYRYDKLDNVVQYTNAREQEIDYGYDAVGRLVQIATPDNTIDWTYDDRGKLLSVEDDDSRIDYTYDALGRVVQVSTQDKGHQPAVELSNSYNTLGNRVGLADGQGANISYSYDVLNRLTAVTGPGGGSVSVAYNGSGAPTRVGFPNGTEAVYTYDSFNRKLSLSHGSPADEPLLDLRYAYNAVGDFSSVTDGGQEQIFAYDALEQLLGVGGSDPQAYNYDRAGNRTSSHLSVAYSHDAANRLLEDDSFSYSYDADGHLIAKIAKDDSSTTSYTYDALGQLVRIDRPDAASVLYRYDGLGRRIEKAVGEQISRYIYDNEQLLLEYDGDNQLVARYIYGQLVDELLMVERGGQVYSVHADHLGSIRLLTDGDGAAVNRYAYDAFGNFVQHEEGVANPFGFTGREWDAESGLYYYRVRYYDPQLGRFISEDPIGLASGDANGYRYIFNSPVNGTDAQGLAGPAGAAAGAVVGGIFNGLSAALDPDKSWAEVALDVAVGAGAGALAGVVCNPVLGGALIAAATELGNAATDEIIRPECQDFVSWETGGRVLVSGALGALGGGLGQRVAGGGPVANDAIEAMVRRPVMNSSGRITSTSLDDVAAFVGQHGDDTARQLLAEARSIANAGGGLENLSRSELRRALGKSAEALENVGNNLRWSDFGTNFTRELRVGNLNNSSQFIARTGASVAERMAGIDCDCD